MPIPYRQIRAVHSDSTIRVYQAFSPAIADVALAEGTLSSPFKMSRMTWIKPSFLWMMYRAGWGYKDEGQSRILAIDILRSGFDWALQHGTLSNRNPLAGTAQLERKRASPVRIQWDPERNLKLAPLAYRTIQVGLSGQAVALYVHSWIQHITDITQLAHEIHALVKARQLERAARLLPSESVYYPAVAGLEHIGLGQRSENDSVR